MKEERSSDKDLEDELRRLLLLSLVSKFESQNCKFCSIVKVSTTDKWREIKSKFLVSEQKYSSELVQNF